MVETAPFNGLLVPVSTPFRNDLSPAVEAFVAHCRWLLGRGADGLAIFGTTSEANSLGIGERQELLDALVDGGIPAELLMPGTGTCALVDTARLTAHAVRRGCGGVLMLPPFYYKGLDDDGLYGYFAEVIERVGDPRLQLYLYHIPPVAGVPVTHGVIARLLTAYPSTVAGIKDSSGDWEHTAGLLERFPGLAIFPGSEQFLLAGLRAGGAGCITATGNINPDGIKAVYQGRDSVDADALQARASALRSTVQRYPVIAAVKVLLAQIHGDPGWRRTRPPLVALDDAREGALMADLTRLAATGSGLAALAEMAPA